MARQAWGLLIITLASVLCGCNAGNDFDPPRTTATLSNAGVVDLSSSTEIDLVEKVAINREQYQQSLELLVDYYTRASNDLRLGQAQKELRGLKTMPHYTYIPEAYAPDASLKATMSIPEADSIFMEAERLRSGASIWNKKLRLAQEKYIQLIKYYPSSDKIDNAAFEIAEIRKKSKDYATALLYYQRTYQWNPTTTEPARFQAAKIMDDYLARRDEALKLYQEAIRLEGTRFPEWKTFAQKRIAELTDTVVKK